MFKISFYRTADGVSELKDFIDGLARKTGKSKDARVQLNQILRFVNLLKSEGTNLPVEIAKYLEDGIWELRPGANRVFFFCFTGDTFVLLHHFRKKTQKTPRREIEKAKAERKDWIARKGEKKNG